MHYSVFFDSWQIHLAFKLKIWFFSLSWDQCSCYYSHATIELQLKLQPRVSTLTTVQAGCCFFLQLWKSTWCRMNHCLICAAHRGDQAVVQVLIGKQDGVFDEDGTGSQDEGGEQVDVDVVPGTVELSAGQKWENYSPFLPYYPPEASQPLLKNHFIITNTRKTNRKNKFIAKVELCRCVNQDITYLQE